MSSLKRLLRPRLRRVDAAVAVLLAVLGFAAAVQVRSNRGDEGVLASARQEDLVAIGAEAVQLEGPVVEGVEGPVPSVRVVAATSFVDGEEGGISVDGTLLRAPYRFTVIGDSATIAAAMAIPGGVTDTVEQREGRAVVTRSENVAVTALRPLDRPRYARPTVEPEAD
ncbi:MAG: DUF881 domain-containing protein [Actinobacteria bacterium]|nr:DUF881 domain-containing protein [Actinomycetota bacterium]